jgi:hypothetical protein
MSNVLSSQSRSPIADAPFAPSFAPTDELFDTRLYSLSGQVGASYQKSAKLVFSMSGGSMFTERRSRALTSVRGYGSNGQLTYSLSRRTQLGAIYSYNNYYFPRGFGRSDVHSWMGQYGRVFSPRWTGSLSAGLYRAESQRLQTVRIDPAVAAIIGITNSVSVAHGVTNGLALEASLGGRFTRTAIALGVTRGITPGNGIYLTSQQDRVFGSVSLVGQRRWNLGFFGSYAHFRQIFDGLARGGFFDSYGGGPGFNYRLFSAVYLNTRADYRRVVLDQNRPGSQFLRNRWSVSVGLAISPGELPLHIW